MKHNRHFPWSFAAIMTLALVVVLTSCSKKDVMMDEPVISPSGFDGEGAVSNQGFGAGDSGSLGAGELATVFFEYDSYSLGSQARDSLKATANWMKANSAATIQIEGHCDERGTTEYNLALGERRAKAAMSYLSKMGVGGSRMSIISYGEERPSDSGHSEQAWSQNRRAAFVILSK